MPTIQEIWYDHPNASVEIPRRFASSTWEHLPDGPIRTTVDEYLRDFPEHYAVGKAPVLLGRARQYKTYALSLTARAIVETYHVPVVWVNVPSDIAGCERDRYSDRTLDRIKRWHDAPFLILDDFAAQEPGKYGGQLLISIAAHRFDAMLPTAWSGNVTVGTDKSPLQSLMPWGPTFVRRLHETGKGMTVFVS